MTDIVKQLRDGFGGFGICADAADEIERLRAECKELRAQIEALMNECANIKNK